MNWISIALIVHSLDYYYEPGVQRKDRKSRVDESHFRQEE